MNAKTAPRRALVVIDVQNEYFEGGGLPIEHPPVAQSLPNITRAMLGSDCSTGGYSIGSPPPSKYSF